MCRTKQAQYSSLPAELCEQCGKVRFSSFAPSVLNMFVSTNFSASRTAANGMEHANIFESTSNLISVKFLLLWLRVVVTAFVTSTKLSYVTMPGKY